VRWLLQRRPDSARSVAIAIAAQPVRRGSKRRLADVR